MAGDARRRRHSAGGSRPQKRVALGLHALGDGVPIDRSRGRRLRRLLRPDGSLYARGLVGPAGGLRRIGPDVDRLVTRTAGNQRRAQDRCPDAVSAPHDRGTGKLCTSPEIRLETCTSGLIDSRKRSEGVAAGAAGKIHTVLPTRRDRARRGPGAASPWTGRCRPAIPPASARRSAFSRWWLKPGLGRSLAVRGLAVAGLGHQHDLLARWLPADPTVGSATQATRSPCPPKAPRAHRRSIGELAGQPGRWEELVADEAGPTNAPATLPCDDPLHDPPSEPSTPEVAKQSSWR